MCRYIGDEGTLRIYENKKIRGCEGIRKGTQIRTYARVYNGSISGKTKGRESKLYTCFGVVNVVGKVQKSSECPFYQATKQRRELIVY